MQESSNIYATRQGDRVSNGDNGAGRQGGLPERLEIRIPESGRFPSYRVVDENGETVGLWPILASGRSQGHLSALVSRYNAHEGLVNALRFYMAICGNTAASVTRESALEAYNMGAAALDGAK